LSDPDAGGRPHGRRFLAAAERGNLKSLEALLSRDVVLRGDDGKVRGSA
jgi:hypothetical protein